MRIGRLELSRGMLILIASVLALIVVLAIASGCSAKVGPDEYGWASWDVCGFEGGVAAELTILAMTARLGCTNPAAELEPELELEPEP